jgi:hypothetical protein
MIVDTSIRFNMDYPQAFKAINGLHERPYYTGQFVGIKSKTIIKN